MRLRQVATALAAVTAGLTAAAVAHHHVVHHQAVDNRVVRHRAPGHRALGHGRTAPVPARVPSPATVPAVATAAPAPDRDAVVLAFVRPEKPTPVVEQRKVPVRCGDNGGRTKAGAPCGARAGEGGRCRHHPVAA